MFGKLHDPNLRDWDPEPYIKIWPRKHQTTDKSQAKPTILSYCNSIDMWVS